ncbi:MAG: aldehyde ferredoxin oxidoreductase family protein [Deltaproteobacteria bacterium]|nr:MAG: aldehyde ferredoxin oxidoreductase family protein [Deltaproteobacteria bacterium]
MYGYQGKFLNVDLSAPNTREMPLAEDELKNFIGGAGLAAKMIYGQVKKGMDPLAPENPLVFATGPFTGTTIPMVSRYAVCGISPLTGYWGEATSGGSFPFRLKGSGYDGLLITGKAKNPVYLYIDNGSAQLKDATHLWGKDFYETQKILNDELKDAKMSVAGIGPAGERLVRYSCVMNDRGRAAGRCGLGALMGSKNLKAVVVAGNIKAELADDKKIKKLTKEAQSTVKGNLLTVAFREYGTLMYTDMGMYLGDVPAKYFTKSIFPAEKVTGQALRQAYSVEFAACLGCPVGCGREVKGFRPDLDTVHGPEYETAIAFGPLCMNFDLDSIIQANHLCNANGMDTISAGVSIAYAMYLSEQGVLTRDKAGLDIKWGDAETVLKLLRMIVDQEGIGKLLSQGTLKMAREFGRDPGEAAQVKGMEMPMHDPRAYHGMAISYATGPRGACHLKGDYYNVDLGPPVLELEIFPGERMSAKGNKAASAAKYQSLKDLYDSLTLCKFAPLSVTQISEILSAITGWKYEPKDILAAGDRSVNIKRVINNKLGLTREDDKLPKICLEPLSEGSTAGVVPDMELLLKEYYEHRQWDWETGRPKKEKLIELSLNQAAEDLYGK